MTGEYRIRARILSPGLALGKAFVVNKSFAAAEKRRETDVETELKRFEDQVRHIARELSDLFQRISRDIRSKDAEILQAQQMILEDDGFKEKVVRLISEEFLPVEEAVEQVMENFSQRLAASPSEYMRERAKDFLDIASYFKSQSIERRGIFHGKIGKESILIVDELFLSAVLACKQFGAIGIVSKNGTPTSHAAILARAFGLPVLVAPSAELEKLPQDSPLLLDGYSGQIVLHPGPETKRRFWAQLQDNRKRAQMEEQMARGPAQTEDGVRISVGINIERLDELDLFSPRHVDEIGLFRTEFLFMFDQKNFPDFEQQAAWYRTVVEHMEGKPVTFRILDVGGDKFLPYFSMGKQNNPYLGLRAHRVFRYHPEILETQLRAILEAAKAGPVRILYPMIHNLEEIDYLNEILHRLPSGDRLQVGIMVETPASVFMIRELLQQVDFISIGTNDLVQYALTVDRNNENVMAFYHPFHPLILRMLHRVVVEAERAGKPVSICGEIASDPRWTPLLLGLGLRSLSMTSAAVARIRRQISLLNTSNCQILARKALQANYERDVQRVIDEFFSAQVPQLQV